MERLLSTLTFGVLLISAVSCDSAGRWKRNEGSSNINNALVIEPKGDEIERPIGQPYILTCRITVDPALVSDLKWLGPDNQTIREEPERKFIRHEQSRIQLVFREVRENDTGLYHCQASYASNNQLSKSVRLKSYLPITWVDAPEEQYATLGEENEMITCVVKASPAATLSWSKAGKQIATGMSDRYAVEQGGLRISEVRQEDEGTYSCSADVVSTGEYQVRQIRFMVYRRPKFTAAPSTAKGVEGEPLRLECRAEGRPTPTITWLSKSNANLGQRDGYTVDADGTLQIAALRREDEGDLTCVAENAAKKGRVETQVSLVVILKPKIEAFVNRTAAVGTRAALECRASGNPLPEVAIRKLSQAAPFVEGDQPTDSRVSFTQIRDGDVNVAVVALDSVERSDDGLYGCTARNDGGEAYVNGHLEVQFPPSFDAMPNVDVYYSWNDNPINLTCIAESIPNATIRWYFSSNRVEASRNKQLTVIGEGPKSILQVTPKDTTHYTSYTCHAQNLLGDAEYVMKLTEAYPPESIQQAIIIEEESTADMVTFRFVGPREISGLEVDAYLVQYRRYDQSWADARRRIWTKGTPYVLEDLQPRETYAFRFAARNPVGTGDWAADVTRQMPEEGPPFRPVIEGAPISDTDFTQTPYPDRYELRWQVPPANGRPIDSFEVSFHKVVRDKSTGMWTQDGPKHTKSRPYPGGSLVMSLNGLDADTFYQVELRAHNIIGFSHPGLTVFKTERSHNQPPPETEKVKSASDDSEASSTTVETAEETYGLVIGVVAVVLLILIVVDFILCRKQKGLMYKVSRMCHRDSYSAKHYTLEEGKGDKDPKLVLNDAEKVSSETAPMISEPEKSGETNGNHQATNGGGLRSSAV